MQAHGRQKDNQDEANVLRIPIAMTLPWRNNGRRAISTGLTPAYYAIYLHEIEICHETDEYAELKLYLQALGEWDLPSPDSSLFAVLREGETWQDVAQAEKRSTSSSRMVRATWMPAHESPGYAEGCLVLPWPRVIMPVGTRRTLAFSFGAKLPWQTAGYSVVTLLEMNSMASTELATCPRTKPPVLPTDPWRPVFPKEVEERFRERERAKESRTNPTA
jgi:hypothetical protein